MQPKMIHYICEKYAVTSNIPVTVFSEGRAEESFLAFPHAPKTGMFSAPVHTLLSQRGGAHYLLTKELLQFGSVWEEESGTCAVVGPVSCIALSDVEFEAVAAENKIPAEHTAQFRQYLSGIPFLTHEHFAAVLQLLYAAFNHAPIGKEAIFSSLPDYEIGSFVNRRMTDISESIGYGDRKPHSNYDLESAILFYISHGMVERLKNFSFGDLHDRIGRTAHDDMRHFKNMVLILNSLSSRAAIKGGLDSETAYTLAEVYAQKIEVSRTLQDLQRLSQHLRLDYAQRVKDLKFANISDLTVTRAMKYASDHITEKISTAQIAKALNVTTPYLSGKFKTVTGLCLMDYIYSEKVKEAQYLLTYTDDPLSRIASYLAFSSQSYFQNIFKKYAGVTPNEYRTKNKNATY